MLLYITLALPFDCISARQRGKKNMSISPLILLLLCHTFYAAVSVPISLGKPGCQQKCGEIIVPYPFGMGRIGNNSSCYLDDWFEIDCQNNSMSTARPFLKRLNLEVLNISMLSNEYLLEQWVEVNNPIIRSSKCNGSSRVSSNGVDLTGSPFTFSGDRNSFAAVGCKTTALMANRDESAFTGCFSDCSGACCNTTIPSNLKVPNVTFNSSEQGCQYAFVAMDGWLRMHQRSRSSCLATVQDLDYVPAVLSWGIDMQSAEGTRLSYEMEKSYSTFHCQLIGSSSTFGCSCRYGFEGNPFLPGRCQDINECEYPSRACQDGSCINTYGSYRCEGGMVHQMNILGALILGGGLPFLIFGIWGSCRTIKKRNKMKCKKKFFKRNGGLLLEQQVSSSQGNVETTKVFTSKELEVATDRFNKERILGQGGQGTVYKGMLPDGRIVAVKKSKIETEGSLIQQFINEVVILSRINHRNIVKLLGCCLETEVPLLVYEFVPNGTLSQYLHGQVEEFPVSWEMRLQIATEVAGALSYLHSAASIPIFHRDIKSSNILLDDKYRAKVADFGTSRSVSIEKTHLTTLVQGTFGYLDPEYFRSSQFTDKSDVYSFGVVLVELLTGQKAISAARIEEGRGLASYFIAMIEENRLFDILDTQVAEQGGRYAIMAFANLAKRCLDLNGRNRPRMTEVRMELERISMLGRASNDSGGSQIEKVEHERSQEVELWDSVSTSTGSAMDGRAALSADSQPLLPDPTW